MNLLLQQPRPKALPAGRAGVRGNLQAKRRVELESLSLAGWGCWLEAAVTSQHRGIASVVRDSCDCCPALGLRQVPLKQVALGHAQLSHELPLRMKFP